MNFTTKGGSAADSGELEDACGEAIKWHVAGRPDLAEQVYRTVLQAAPNHGLANHCLGMLHVQLRRSTDGLPYLRAALNASPELQDYWLGYFEALLQAGEIEDALQTLALASQHGLAGSAVEDLRVRLQEAALLALVEERRFAEARTEAAAMTQRHPGRGLGWKILGAMCWAAGNSDAALMALQMSARLMPTDAEMHSNLGMVLAKLQRFDEGAAHLDKAIEINPHFAAAHYRQAMSYELQGRYPEAEASLRTAVALRSSPLSDDDVQGFSNLLYLLSYNARVDIEALFLEHLRVGEELAAGLPALQSHSNGADPDRRLQIGLVSGDLRNHAVSTFLEPVLAHLRADEQLEFHAYSTCAAEDEVTARLRGYVTHWNSVAQCSDAVLAQTIAADRIDILIDLSGHTGMNRLRTFARKPAPVQMSWLGYPCTTGLLAMDYYLSDPCFLPPGQFDRYFTEKLIYLHAFAPYQPPICAPAVNELPALTEGSLRFGSFNRVAKISDSSISLWSQLLLAVPSATMLLAGMSQGRHSPLIERFLAHGVTPDRLTFHPRCDMNEYLSLHHQVDLCLDTTPYSGGTTTCHAMWMGVPTLTLVGTTPASRQSAANHAMIGLRGFCAKTTAEFLEKGIFWSTHLRELATVRAALRARWQQAPGHQPKLAAEVLKCALRETWRRWCAGLPASSFAVNDIHHRSPRKPCPTTKP